MALMWWEKGLWQICMHYCTVHGKVDFQKFPSDVSTWGGVRSTERARSQDLTLFPFYCVHHHRSFWRKTKKNRELLQPQLHICTENKQNQMKVSELLSLILSSQGVNWAYYRIHGIIVDPGCPSKTSWTMHIYKEWWEWM